jgi:iron complex outermembrane receptor protein
MTRSARSGLTVAAMAAALLASTRVEAQVRDTTVRDTTVRDSSRALGTVTVRATRSPTMVGSASAVVIRPDSLRLPAMPVLEDALRDMPFVLVRQNSRGEAEISVRGSDSRQSAVLVDGVPLTLGWDNRTDPSIVPLAGASQLVYVRGLSSLLQGPNVLGGVLELGMNRSDEGARRTLELRTGFDQTGAQGYAVNGVLPRGALTLRGGAEYRTRDGVALAGDVDDPATADPDLRTNSDLKELDGHLAARWSLANGGWVGASATTYVTERGVPPELHLQSPRLWRYPDQSRTLAIVSGGTGRRTTPLGSGDAELIVGWNTGHTEIEKFATSAYDSIVGGEKGDERAFSARLLADHSLGRGELRTAFTFVDVTYRETLDADPSSDYRQTLWSTAAEVEHPLGGTWRLSGGLALDGADTPETGGKPSSGSLTDWAGRLGISTLVASGPTRLHAALSRRARFPALRELYSGALGVFEPNPDLKPETLVGFEAGATLLRQDVQFQAVVFHHDLDDAVIRIGQPDGKFKRVNKDELTSTGLELLAGWTGARLSVNGDLLLQRVRLLDQTAADATERRPENVPEFRIGADVTMPIGFGVRALAGVGYTGTQYCTNAETGSQDTIDGAARADLGADREWRIGRPGGLWSAIRATLSFDNVTDAAVYDQCGLPQPGRTVRFGLALR